MFHALVFSVSFYDNGQGGLHPVLCTLKMRKGFGSVSKQIKANYHIDYVDLITVTIVVNIHIGIPSYSVTVLIVY